MNDHPIQNTPLDTGKGGSLSQKIPVEQRRLQIMEFRKAGYSVQAIADHFNIAVPTVYGDLRIVLDRLKEAQTLNMDDLRSIELQTLDAMQASIYQRAISGDLAAQKGMDRIMQRRARLLGLDVPLRMDSEILRLILILLDRRGQDPNAFLRELYAELQADFTEEDPKNVTPPQIPPQIYTEDDPDPSITFDS